MLLNVSVSDMTRHSMLLNVSVGDMTRHGMLLNVSVGDMTRHGMLLNVSVSPKIMKAIGNKHLILIRLMKKIKCYCQKIHLYHDSW
jgi:hypothetical protein